MASLRIMIISALSLGASLAQASPTTHPGCTDHPIFKGIKKFHSTSSPGDREMIKAFDKHGQIVSDTSLSEGSHYVISVERDKQCRPKLIKEIHESQSGRADGLVNHFKFKFDNKRNRLQEVAVWNGVGGAPQHTVTYKLEYSKGNERLKTIYSVPVDEKSRLVKERYEFDLFAFTVQGKEEIATFSSMDRLMAQIQNGLTFLNLPGMFTHPDRRKVSKTTANLKDFAVFYKACIPGKTLECTVSDINGQNKIPYKSFAYQKDPSCGYHLLRMQMLSEYSLNQGSFPGMYYDGKFYVRDMGDQVPKHIKVDANGCPDLGEGMNIEINKRDGTRGLYIDPSPNKVAHANENRSSILTAIAH